MMKFLVKRDKMMLLIENNIEFPKDYLEFNLLRKYDKGYDNQLTMQLNPDEIRMLVYNLNSWLIEREVIK